MKMSIEIRIVGKRFCAKSCRFLVGTVIFSYCSLFCTDLIVFGRQKDGVSADPRPLRWSSCVRGTNYKTKSLN
jgi:hypothetical protein